MPVLTSQRMPTLQSSIDAVRQGARDYLLKPVDPPLILTRVHDILAEQRQSQRRHEIVAQIQSLLAELRQIDGEDANTLPVNLLSAVPPTPRPASCNVAHSHSTCTLVYMRCSTDG